MQCHDCFSTRHCDHSLTTMVLEARVVLLIFDFLTLPDNSEQNCNYAAANTKLVKQLLEKLQCWLLGKLKRPLQSTQVIARMLQNMPAPDYTAEPSGKVNLGKA